MPDQVNSQTELWYADYTLDYSEGVCQNERPVPNGRATYGSLLECCERAYGSQRSGALDYGL